MQQEYLQCLPGDVQQLVIETERAIGFQVEVVVDSGRVRGVPGQDEPMACEVNWDFSRMLVVASDQFRPNSAFHELLHIRRFLVEGVPTLVDCADYEPWTPAIGTALTMHDNAFEHLVIVPIELQRFPERREHWEAVMERVWNDIAARRGDELSRRQLGLASWAFLRLVLPDSPNLPLARAALEASDNLERAERFCEDLFPLLGDKDAAVRVWFRYQDVPLEMASLKYFEPLEYRAREVPLVP